MILGRTYYNARPGLPQQLCRAILPDTGGQLKLFKFVPDEFVAFAGFFQTLCGDQNGVLILSGRHQ
ncbi:hypothetical protein WG68_06935 [Arsukibacterium ikkense]|uniref:Uncharacterized protein n=1 Tax=Arsukibacterium ikkense TaxID=336831 RepID=A0A0M2VAC1_9GAMM|nr:hypothetical protein WG68_06935 [Arsukibacterium ikkense]